MDLSVQLYQGDCLGVMRGIPDGSVDMILADLPYGTTACKWDTIIPLEPLWAHYKRVIKHNGAVVLTASQPFTSALVMSNPSMFRYQWVWHKTRVTGWLDAKRKPLKTHEDVCVFYANPPTYNPQMTIGDEHLRGPRALRQRPNETYHSFFDGPKGAYVSSEYYPRSVLSIGSVLVPVHPNEKPVALMEYLIRTYTNEGDVVLDNVMGSGTTGVACINTGRSFIGIERDPGYFKIAQDRINKAQEAAQQLTFEATA